MALRFLGATDIFPYIEAVKAAQSLSDFKVHNNAGSVFAIYKYAQRFDQVVVMASVSAGGGRRLHAIDPLLVNTDALRSPLVDSTQNDTVFPGYFDPTTGAQSFYIPSDTQGFGNAATYLTFDYPTLTEGAAAFGGGIKMFQKDTTPTLPGEWSAPLVASGTPNEDMTAAGHVLVFEGMKDGIAGETLLTGTNVYPNGLALVRCGQAQIGSPFDNGADGASDGAICWIDLATSNAVGLMSNFPGRASTQIDPYTQAPIAGQSFTWTCKQFIPDVDSTPLSPKGELFLASNPVDIPADPANFAQSIFVKMVDFNPRGVTATGGAPTRTHKQVRLLSSLDFNIAPIFDVGTAISLTVGVDFFNSQTASVFYHPPSRRFCLFLVTAAGSPGSTNVANQGFIGYWSRQVEPTLVTNPIGRSFPRTNAVNPYESTVLGHLGEVVSGQTVDWTLERLDTQGELLTGTFAPASTSTVAHFPIDQKYPTATEGSLVVYANGTPLVQGTNYTVVLATGVITWVTNHAGQTMTADYVHRQTPASPPHGILLTTESVSGADGRAFTDVRYADDADLIGKMDLLTSTTS